MEYQLNEKMKKQKNNEGRNIKKKMKWNKIIKKPKIENYYIFVVSDKIDCVGLKYDCSYLSSFGKQKNIRTWIQNRTQLKQEKNFLIKKVQIK